jgi:hypothetical protein
MRLLAFGFRLLALVLPSPFSDSVRLPGTKWVQIVLACHLSEAKACFLEHQLGVYKAQTTDPSKEDLRKISRKIRSRSRSSLESARKPLFGRAVAGCVGYGSAADGHPKVLVT